VEGFKKNLPLSLALDCRLWPPEPQESEGKKRILSLYLFSSTFIGSLQNSFSRRAVPVSFFFRSYPLPYLAFSKCILFDLFLLHCPFRLPSFPPFLGPWLCGAFDMRAMHLQPNDSLAFCPPETIRFCNQAGVSILFLRVRFFSPVSSAVSVRMVLKSANLGRSPAGFSWRTRCRKGMPRFRSILRYDVSPTIFILTQADTDFVCYWSVDSPRLSGYWIWYNFGLVFYFPAILHCFTLLKTPKNFYCLFLISLLFSSYSVLSLNFSVDGITSIKVVTEPPRRYFDFRTGLHIRLADGGCGMFFPVRRRPGSFFFFLTRAVDFAIA